MKHGSGSVVGRLVAIVAGLVAAGLFLKLLAALLQPVLPPSLWQAVSGGFDLLLSLVGPALIPIAAAVILGGLVWVFVGRRR
ncbi:hypothetical protein OG439_46325 [Amycolatopsis sp. NBC_01307]|uniref:hypothetical protein n=1 Tax=Amycolatopsis sp. NBC_01307 TaxID=2903561 RepID=UPI002E115A5E|nr:hypothetical protein OG439_46325 [Amycolatopsis sp. NBC_01307]